jgi:mono/diheme cytochrome c family protein
MRDIPDPAPIVGVMTRAIIRSFAAVLGLVLLTACAASYEPPLPEPASADQASIERGHQLAEHFCSTCHAIGATGESRHPAAPPFRTLSRNYPVNDLAEAFAEGILVGHRDMPEFRFEPNQIDDLVNYLQSIQDHRSG